MPAKPCRRINDSCLSRFRHYGRPQFVPNGVALTTGHWLFWSVALIATGSLVALVFVQLTASFAIRRANGKRAPGQHQPSVSVLKPIKGADVSLSENLTAFARQDYPDFELVLGIEDPEDPAIPVVRSFQRNHPEVPIQVLIGAPAVGMNPKVNNLTFMSRFASHDLWLISDADVVPEPGYLARLVSEWDGESVGLVHSTLVGQDEQTLGAIFESIHLNTLVASMIWGASVAGHHCVIGKSVLFHKELLAQMGGWRTFENVLAEDYMLGRFAKQCRVRVKLCTDPLPVRNRERSLSSFINRHVRWAQMRRRISLFAYLCESTSNPLAWLALLWALAGLGPSGAVFGRGFWLASLVFVLVKCLSDEVMARSVRRSGLGLLQLALVPLKDLLIAGIWWVGFFKRSVNWRGNVMFIGPGTQLSPPLKENLAANRA